MTESAVRSVRSRGRKIGALVLLLAVCLGVGQLGAVLTRPRIDDWYAALEKPAWTPPDIAFPIVWTTLYVLMALAAWLMWLRAKPSAARLPFVLFFVQLALNFLWSALFFGWRSPDLALIEIAVLLAVLVATIVSFARISRSAAWLLVPYLLWTGFAAALNFTIWQLNA